MYSCSVTVHVGAHVQVQVLLPSVDEECESTGSEHVLAMQLSVVYWCQRASCISD